MPSNLGAGRAGPVPELLPLKSQPPGSRGRRRGCRSGCLPSCHLCQDHPVLLSAPRTARACWLCGSLAAVPPTERPTIPDNPPTSGGPVSFPAETLAARRCVWEAGQNQSGPPGGPGGLPCVGSHPPCNCCPGRGGEVGQLGRHRVCNAKKSGLWGAPVFISVIG